MLGSEVIKKLGNKKENQEVPFTQIVILRDKIPKDAGLV